MPGECGTAGVDRNVHLGCESVHSTATTDIPSETSGGALGAYAAALSGGAGSPDEAAAAVAKALGLSKEKLHKLATDAAQKAGFCKADKCTAEELVAWANTQAGDDVNGTAERGGYNDTDQRSATSTPNGTVSQSNASNMSGSENTSSNSSNTSEVVMAEVAGFDDGSADGSVNGSVNTSANGSESGPGSGSVNGSDAKGSNASNGTDTLKPSGENSPADNTIVVAYIVMALYGYGLYT